MAAPKSRNHQENLRHQDHRSRVRYVRTEERERDKVSDCGV